jgi:hypothetical protein
LFEYRQKVGSGKGAEDGRVEPQGPHSLGSRSDENASSGIWSGSGRSAMSIVP